MMKSWRGSLAGSTWKGSFELPTSGSKLKDLMSKEVQPDNAYVRADTAGPAFFRASLQTSLRCMIVLIGIGATCIGIVKDEW